MPDPTPRGPAASSDDGEAGAAEPGFDQIVGRLRGVVERLEAGSLGLEQALAAFEEGVRLARRGAEILDRAEQRVEVLTKNLSGNAGGGAEVAPFVVAGAGSGDGDGST
jgi:exodeoxyribonuclease VII small subunit